MVQKSNILIASFGSGRGNTLEIKLPNVVDPNPRLIITDEIIGYTCQYIYGEITDVDYDSIVVPVYKIDLKVKEKIINSFGVTRDSWYSRGVIDDGFIYDDIELTNRCFEPFDGLVNLFSTTPLKYQGIDAFALRQKNNEKLNAEPHTEKMNTTANGLPIDEPRPDLTKATGVMIHIGGYYHNNKYKKDKLGGSYGCFGFIPKHQMGSKSKMEEWRKDNSYEKVETSNMAYKKFVDEVVNTRDKSTGKLRVLIIKRTNVEKYKVLKNQ